MKYQIRKAQSGACIVYKKKLFAWRHVAYFPTYEGAKDYVEDLTNPQYVIGPYQQH